MDPSQIDTLVQRLVVNPHDEQALAAAHQSGTADPKSYALLLERVGAQTPDPAYASHWLSEAANVWSTTLGDAHRAARVLMQAIERDPTQRPAADRLAELYREKGDVKALVALLERRAKALAPLASQSADVAIELTAMHEELGRLWSERLQQPRKALDNFRRAIDLDPTNAFAIYGAREIYKALGHWDEAAAMYEAEQAIERDPARKIALARDEAATRRAAGDLAGATQAFARARQVDAQDPGLAQEYGATIVERLAAGMPVPAQERMLGAELLVGLAEVYDGEHGLAYSAGALDVDPGHDRALQLYAYYARALQKEEDVATRYLAYLHANPTGAMGPEARWLLATSYEGAGQYDEAIQILEPLRASGDAQATGKLRELYGEAGRPMPSVAPPPPPPLQRGAGRPASPPAASAPAGPKKTGVELAQELASSGRRDEAYATFRAVLEVEPAHAEALSWVEDYLRTKRDYPALRDLLIASVRIGGMPVVTRQERLREIAGLSEGNLRDVDGAISAWKELISIDRSDESARQALTRAYEKTQRWDELALLIEYEATAEADLEKKIALEKRLATLHEQKRQDFSSAAEAWERIAILVPEDDNAIATASALFERAGSPERAAQVIATNTKGLDDPVARDALTERLAVLRERLGDAAGAGQAYFEAAGHQKSPRLWEAAERCFVAAQQWDRAGGAAVQRALLDADRFRQARHYARAADHFGQGGDEASFVENLTHSTELDPENEDFARLLGEQHAAAGRWNELVLLLTRRADSLSEPARRVEVRREAARLYTSRLANHDAARDVWQKVLADAEDREALESLVEDSVRRDDYEGATRFLRRLERVATDAGDKARIALREAEIVADGIGDVDAAITRYERILVELDASCRPALQAIADLQEARDNPTAAADALERELRIVSDPVERGPIAERLARLYEQLDRPESAIVALDVVRLADRDDFDALARLCKLCEKTRQWAKLAGHLAERIEVEADEDEISALTKKLGHVLADELDRGDEALAVFEDLANRGDASIRAAYVALGDRLGWRGVVAGKLVEWWFDAKPSPERVANLRGAFERFADVGRDEEAIRVACEIERSGGGDLELARHLEQLAVKATDLDALAVAHGLQARELTGLDRARELVRQAEVQSRAGAPRLQALQHGEEGLTSSPVDETEPLLVRLAAIAEDKAEIVGLYERQIGRAKNPVDRVNALARAAQVAAFHGHLDRARALFDSALATTPTDDAIATLETAARDADALAGDDVLRRTLCAALANGGQGARDGGRTRGSLLRRAASMIYVDLADVDQAFTWLGDALVAHVETASLDALEHLAHELEDPHRAEATLTRALGEAFDGPAVRQLVARRANLRRDELNDRPGAAADFKKLYDLAPNDQPVLEQLSALLTELRDHRAMVQLYEDQILRGKDPGVRAEQARRVARLWEVELGDPREAADAWRRVLRMKPGDTEATAGLDRAKANMLRKAPDAVEPEADDPPPHAIRLPGEPTPRPPIVHADQTSPANASLASDEIVASHKDADAKRSDGVGPAAEAGGAATESDKSEGGGAEAPHEAAAAPLTNTLTPSLPNEEGPQDASSADERRAAQGEVDIALDDASLVDDVVIADDLAEMLESDGDDGAPEQSAVAPEPALHNKRTIPPPLPRA